MDKNFREKFKQQLLETMKNPKDAESLEEAAMLYNEMGYQKEDELQEQYKPEKTFDEHLEEGIAAGRDPHEVIQEYRNSEDFKKEETRDKELEKEIQRRNALNKIVKDGRFDFGD